MLSGVTQGLRCRLDSYPEYPDFASEEAAFKRYPTRKSMWETNTFAATVHARLNVAKQRFPCYILS